jgi:uncharacterized repeat protein (TIGR03803 family)
MRDLIRSLGFLFALGLAACAHSAAPPLPVVAFAHSPGSASYAHYGAIYYFKGGKDGWSPSGPVAFHAGILYGVAEAGGGKCNCGVVYSYAHGRERVIYAFKGGKDGSVPRGALAFGPHGTIFGTAGAGGSGLPYGEGTVFKLTPSRGRYVKTNLYSFSGPDGSGPNGLIADAKYNLYGITLSGGPNAACGCGTVYKMTPLKGGAYKHTILHGFSSAPNASGPVYGLVRAGSTLYGAASSGGLEPARCGSGGCGAIYSISTSGKGFKVLYQFQAPPDVSSPYQIVPGPAGSFYGVAQAGGAVGCSYEYLGCGGVFSLTPSGGTYVEKVLYSFNGPPSDGGNPEGVTPYAGTLWGVTSIGGNGSYAGNQGTVFELVPASGGTYTEAVDFAMKFDTGVHPLYAWTVYNDSLYSVATSGGPAFTTCFSERCGAILELATY